MTGAGGTVIRAKMLGFGDEFATATKVAEKATAEAVSTYPPPYFFKLVEKINSMGDDITKKAATQDRQVVKSSYEKDNIGQILDYDETPENNNVKFVGGPIFKNFLKNITPTSTEKLVGLDTLINEEKKKMIERGSSSLPVKVAETAALGGELIAPIFPGLKLLRAYAKSKSLPANDDTKQLLEQDVDMVLESNGMDRRQFLQITGTGGAVILAKMLGFGDEFATATKVAEKATAEAA